MPSERKSPIPPELVRPEPALGSGGEPRLPPTEKPATDDELWDLLNRALTREDLQAEFFMSHPDKLGHFIRRGTIACLIRSHADLSDKDNRKQFLEIGMKLYPSTKEPPTKKPSKRR